MSSGRCGTTASVADGRSRISRPSRRDSRGSRPGLPCPPNRRGPTLYQVFLVTDGLITRIEGHDDRNLALAAIAASG